MNKKSRKWLRSVKLFSAVSLTAALCLGCGADQTADQTQQSTVADGAVQASEQTAQASESAAEQNESKADSGHINAIEVDGVVYQKKTRVKTYLLLGVDSYAEDDKNAPEGVIDGQSDFIELLVIDQNRKSYALLPINRNTITAVDSLDEEGNYIATTDVQICLAHSKGSGGTDSCENAVKAVENLLGGEISIDGYASVSLDSIGLINDLVGGVTVTIEDDFSQCDESLVMGETITLNGEQAEHYARHRMDVADGTNENRMKRQKNYMEALRQTLVEQCQSDENFALSLYEELDSFMVTDMKGKDFSKVANTAAKNEYLGSYEITGKTELDWLEHEAFYADAESIKAVVLELYYEPITDK